MSDRAVHALVIASGGAYRDHEQLAGYVWERADPSHLEFTVSLHHTADVEMASDAFKECGEEPYMSPVCCCLLPEAPGRII